ncbi:MAG TPA: fimbria/pilus periplasmic chaperone [Steroidobacteraceae bacterium]|nr:fimbria/pilus periplasmic chaperone [Steroidobacteraceae bacterium]HQR48342.1 fimbria/pilus periplasmic chaperone [Steroidobacteraceae bacterium]
MLRYAAIISVLASAAAFGLPPASAGSFSISPLRAELSQQATTAAITVRNMDAAPVIVQASTFAWSQPDGEDHLEATKDLLVSPAVFTIPPNGSQLVRVALRRDADPRRELAYRLTLQEVPPQAAPDFTGLTVALKLSLPVFVAANSPSPAQLDWSAARGADGAVVLGARNDGETHAKILNVTLTPLSGDAATLQQSVAAYVLPGVSRSWTIRNENDKNGSTAAADRYRLKANTERGEVDAELTVGR